LVLGGQAGGEVGGTRLGSVSREGHLSYVLDTLVPAYDTLARCLVLLVEAGRAAVPVAQLALVCLRDAALKSSQAKSSQVKPSHAKPRQVKPSQARLRDAVAARVALKSSQAKPSQVKPS
jgi:hypothetical protein